MKKEHWLYLIIVILAVWLIAKYTEGPKNATVNTDLSETGTSTEQAGDDSAVQEDKGVPVTETAKPATGANVNVSSVVDATAPNTAQVIREFNFSFSI